MKLLDNLAKIFEAKFSHLFSENKINFLDFSRNVTNVIEIKDGAILTIDLSKATDEEKREIKVRVVDVIIQEEKNAFLDINSKEKTLKLKKIFQTEKIKICLCFIKINYRPTC